MISLAEALYIAFERHANVISAEWDKDHNNVLIDDFINFEDIADELKDILLEE